MRTYVQSDISYSPPEIGHPLVARTIHSRGLIIFRPLIATIGLAVAVLMVPAPTGGSINLIAVAAAFAFVWAVVWAIRVSKHRIVFGELGIAHVYGSQLRALVTYAEAASLVYSIREISTPRRRLALIATVRLSDAHGQSVQFSGHLAFSREKFITIWRRQYIYTPTDPIEFARVLACEAIADRLERELRDGGRIVLGRVILNQQEATFVRRFGPSRKVSLSDLRTDTSDFEINFYSRSMGKRLARVSLRVPNVLPALVVLGRISDNPSIFRAYSKFE
jgi:hypothetical protein